MLFLVSLAGNLYIRLSNRLEEDLQKLRCRVNYHALKFTKDIQAMGNTVVERLRHHSRHYIAIHLRCANAK
jgi:hypothetical protein